MRMHTKCVLPGSVRWLWYAANLVRKYVPSRIHNNLCVGHFNHRLALRRPEKRDFGKHAKVLRTVVLAFSPACCSQRIQILVLWIGGSIRSLCSRKKS